jgi:hypothetical protein
MISFHNVLMIVVRRVAKAAFRSVLVIAFHNVMMIAFRRVIMNAFHYILMMVIFRLFRRSKNFTVLSASLSSARFNQFYST